MNFCIKAFFSAIERAAWMSSRFYWRRKKPISVFILYHHEVEIHFAMVDIHDSLYTWGFNAKTIWNICRSYRKAIFQWSYQRKIFNGVFFCFINIVTKGVKDRNDAYCVIIERTSTICSKVLYTEARMPFCVVFFYYE